MKNIFLLLFIFILNGILFVAEAQENAYKVIKVIDGDTVYIDFNNNGIPDKDEKVRLNGIDTFETKPTVYLEAQMEKYNLTQDEAPLYFPK